MKKIKVEIKGITPYLQNRFCGEENLETTKKKVITGKLASVEEKLYKLPDGTLYIPAEHFRACFIEAGKSFKGKGKTNLSKIIASMIDIEPEAIPIKPQKYEIDRRTGVNPMTKGRMLIERPMFRDWSCEFNVLVDTDELLVDKIKELIDYAGLYVGIGDYRPAKKGRFGKFMLTQFKPSE